MGSCIEIGGFFDEVLEALVESGLYASKAEVVRDALRRLIESIDLRSVALHAYRRGATLWRAYRISSVSFEEFLSFLVARGIVPDVGCDKVPPTPSASRFVLDPVGVELFGRIGVLKEIANYLVEPEELIPIVKHVEAVSGERIPLEFRRVVGYRQLVKKLQLSIEEAAVVKLAEELNVPLAVCDARLAARLAGIRVRCICCYALLRFVDESIWLSRMKLLPIPIPEVEKT